MRSKVAISKGVITERDVLALQWVCEQGLMTIDQFWRAIWWNQKSKGPRYAYERILLLERNGFLEKIKTPFSQKFYFRATKSGIGLASDRMQDCSIIPIFQTPSQQIPHVDLLTELRLIVSQAEKIGSWATDRVLMTDLDFPKDRFHISVPDVLWVTKKGRRIAIEYERTSKAISRVRAKVQSYERELLRQDSLIDLVLWISSPVTHKTLSSLLVGKSKQRLRTFNELKMELENGVDSGSG